MMNSNIDELIRSKRKTISLTITRDARLVVRAPLKLPLREIEKLIEEKKNWIINKKKLATERLKNAQAFGADESGSYLFLGQPMTLVMSEEDKPAALVGQNLMFPAKLREHSKEIIQKWYKKQAGILLPQRLSEISRIIGIPYAKCRITSAKRQWGSCNGRNNINLTWRLIMASPKAIDYVIVHELCHVIHKNHSRDFWNKVREYMPDFAACRKWLKDNSYILDLLD